MELLLLNELFNQILCSIKYLHVCLTAFQVFSLYRDIYVGTSYIGLCSLNQGGGDYNAKLGIAILGTFFVLSETFAVEKLA